MITKSCPKPFSTRIQWLFWCIFILIATPSHAKDLKVLFLGDRGSHEPSTRFLILEPAMTAAGIALTYTEDMNAINTDNLAQYDALVVYANIDSIDPPQEKAILEYVSGGGGFVPIHCATYCFRNSKEIVALMGAQFQRHGTGVFRTEIANTDHPLMRGFGGFESWDETYVHHLHNEKNRTVLTYRVDGEGREPWTWIRTHGQGRVFYTAWGHDYRTWRNPGFHNLIERGIRWSVGENPNVVAEYTADRPFPVPKMTAKRTDVKPFEFVDVGKKIPNYTAGAKWGTQEEPISRMQTPLAPEESLKHFVVPEGFHVELFASEPDIGGKPICMNWDERGRLWIAETYDYPNELQPPGKGRDRIRILEDTTGDGKADKFTVFVDKLSIPTSIMFHQGGVIVQDGTETKYFKDTNGDDVADESKILLTGWVLNDTHGGVGNFQYGLDNWIWAMQGYNDSSPRPLGVKSDDRKAQRFRQGFFRFRPDGSQIEFLRSTNNNTWGLGLSEEGIVFGSTANGYPSVYMPIPNRYYERVRGWTPSLVLGGIADSFKFQPIVDIRQVDWHGGYTAGAGHALYTAREYPKEYWNRTAFVNGPTGHLVGTFVIREEGTDYTSTNSFNLLASDDGWSAPIMAEVGPDGNVWVIDWYNYIVQHNPTPNGFEKGKGNAYETDLRDKKYGRIYRVVYGDAPHKPWDTLADATQNQLVQTLKHPTMLWRKHAQRLLVERGRPDIADKLIELVNDQTIDEIGLNVGATHALWTLHGIDQFDGSNPAAMTALYRALKHPARGVRRNALQALPLTIQSTQTLLRLDLLGDKDAQVRLAALLALSDLPIHEQTGAALVAMWNRQSRYQDRWTPDAFVSAAATNDRGFLAALAESTDADEKLAEMVRIVAEHFARGGDADAVPPVVAALVDAQPSIINAAVTGMQNGWPAGSPVKMEAGLERKLLQLVDKLDPVNRGSLIKLAQNWGSQQFEEYGRMASLELLERLDNPNLDIQERLSAAREVVQLRSKDEAIVGELLSRIDPQIGSTLASGIVEALGDSESETVGPSIAARFGSFTPAVRSTVISILMQRPASTEALLSSIDKGDLRLSELTLEQTQSLANHPTRSIRDRAKAMLSRGGALSNADRQKVIADYLPITKSKGDSVVGKEIFTKQCATCHEFNGLGVAIGPNLSGMAAHPKHELLTHILDPSRDVEGNYRRYSVITDDGLVINGMLASESKTAIELIDEKAQKRVILREDIDELTGSTKSVMPEGFENLISKKQMSNLLEYLTERGSFVPVVIQEVATISTDTGMFVGGGDAEKLIFNEWGAKEFHGVPFHVVDPQGGTVLNAIELFGPNGGVSKKMPKNVQLPIQKAKIKSVHMLGGVSGWGFPFDRNESVSMIVRIQYENGDTEDHQLLNGQHFADYIKRVDVPQSEFAFAVREQQIRYLAIYPKRKDPIESIQLVKGPDDSAPVTMAITLELYDRGSPSVSLPQ